MISWMQRHRKYLVITIWISTIAFIGAGFVGWGQYSYGEKAGAVAKVGDVPISLRELQQSYSRLYNQYNQMFQGKFDEAQAKSMGLQRQALRQLIDQALILNLANSYNLIVTDKELLSEIQAQKVFYKNGKFDKEIYKKALRQNNLNMQEYEADVRKSMLIQKTFALFSQETLPLETKSVGSALSIADKIEYKILTSDMVSVDRSDSALKAFWETRKESYMQPPSYELEIIKQKSVDGEVDEIALKEYYQSHKSDYTDDKGVLLTFDKAKDQVTADLNDKATRKEALRTYIAYKKSKLGPSVTIEKITVDRYNDSFDTELFAEIEALTLEHPYLKPRKINGVYNIIKLAGVNPSKPKTFEAAKEEVEAQYAREQAAVKLLELAKKEVADFKGKTSDFITIKDITALEGLNEAEAREFLNVLFKAEKGQGIAGLQTQKIVLYKVIDQKFLAKDDSDQADTVKRLKTAMLEKGLIKSLNESYKTEIFMEGF